MREECAIRNTTFYWLSVPQGPLFSAVSPGPQIALARTAGDAGSKARHEIIDRYRGDMYQIGLLLARSPEDAKDLAQDFAVRFLDAQIYTAYDEQKGGFRAFLKGWARNWVRTHRNVVDRRDEVPIEDVDAPSREEALEDVVDRLITQTRVTEALQRTEKALDEIAHAWEVFDLWQLQREDACHLTYQEVAERVGITPRHVETLLEIARGTFLRHLLMVISPELRDPDHMAQELDITRGLLETALARAWKRPVPTKPRDPAANA